MSFISLPFALFVVVTLIFYYALERRGQSLVIAVAALVFLGSWGWPSLATFLCFSVLFYFAARRGRRDAAVFSLLAVGVVMLALRARGFRSSSMIPLTYLLGLSYYSLQGLSYVLDVRRKQAEAESDFFQFFAYFSFFPLLTLGPIQRHADFAPQLRARRPFERDRFLDGLFQISLGVFKKIVIADRIAVIDDIFRRAGGQMGALEAWLALILLVVQLYCDFSAYSDLACGLGQLFGFNLVPNFDRPYLARNVGEFWNRWNLSLMAWFRDYVYWPLLLVCRNVYLTTFLIFILIGCWHSLLWNYLLGWIYLALIYLVWMALKRKRWLRVAHRNVWTSALTRIALLLALSFTGIFFPAENWEDLRSYLTALVRPEWIFHALGRDFTWTDGLIVLVGCAVVIGFEGLYRRAGPGRAGRLNVMFLILILLSALLGVANSRSFIYMAY